MPPPKRKRQSGSTGIELPIALEALKNLAAKVSLELNTKAEGEPELESDEAEDNGTVLSQIERLTAVLQARADRPQEMTGDLLDDLKVRFGGVLKLKDDAARSAAWSDTLGSDQLWSATYLLTHLHFLETLFPCTCQNVPETRQWIEAFFFRVSAMMPDHLEMALSFDPVVPAVPVSGSSRHTGSAIDFTATVMDPAKLRLFLERPVLRLGHSVFFASQAKDVTKSLQRHIPEVVAEMLGYARRAKKTIVRGAVTDGLEWIFLILTLRDDDGTATYVRSDEINVSRGFTIRQTSKAGVSLISAILAHWILHSHQPLDGTTDFFES